MKALESVRSRTVVCAAAFSLLALLAAWSRADVDPTTAPGGNAALSWVEGSTTEYALSRCNTKDVGDCIGSGCISYSGKVVDTDGKTVTMYKSMDLYNTLPYGNCVYDEMVTCKKGTVSCAWVNVYSTADCGLLIDTYLVYAKNCCTQ